MVERGYTLKPDNVNEKQINKRKKYYNSIGYPQIEDALFFYHFTG